MPVVALSRNLHPLEWNLISLHQKQLGEVLYEKLNSGTTKSKKHQLVQKYKCRRAWKNKRRASHCCTDNRVSNWPNYSTYIDTLPNHVQDDGRFTRTLFKQEQGRAILVVKIQIYKTTNQKRAWEKVREASGCSSWKSARFHGVTTRRLTWELLRCFRDKHLIEILKRTLTVHCRNRGTRVCVSGSRCDSRYASQSKKAINLWYFVMAWSHFHARGDDVERAEACVLWSIQQRFYFGLMEYLEEVKAVRMETRLYGHLSWRRREVPLLKKSASILRVQGERIAIINAPIQGTSADVIKLAIDWCVTRTSKKTYKTKWTTT